MKRVLIIDDLDDTLFYLRAVLEGHGHVVEEAPNGEKALARMRQSPPDLIISDLMMPVMDGYTLCQTCKSDPSLRHIPFVFYTAAYADKKAEQLALSLGADAFIIKPLHPEQLAERIEEILARGSQPSTRPPLPG